MIPKISEAEWTVMKVLWERSPRTANDVIEALAGAAEWEPATIKTLLNRLLKKKALGFEKRERHYVYFPLVDEATCQRVESRSFLQRVFGGALQPMLANLLEERKLSPEELEELKRILEENQKGGK